MTVASQPVLAVGGTTTLAEALTALRTAGLRHLAVLGADGRCLGVLDDRALAAAWVLDPVGFGRIPVTAVLPEEPAVVPRQSTVAEVARAMRHHRGDAVVLVDHQGAAAGLITGSDLVALLAKPAWRPPPSVREETPDMP